MKLKELEDSELVYFSLKIVHYNFGQKSHILNLVAKLVEHCKCEMIMCIAL